jgi:hypothetical protein
VAEVTSLLVQSSTFSLTQKQLIWYLTLCPFQFKSPGIPFFSTISLGILFARIGWESRLTKRGIFTVASFSPKVFLLLKLTSSLPPFHTSIMPLLLLPSFLGSSKQLLKDSAISTKRKPLLSKMKVTPLEIHLEWRLPFV